MAEYLKTLYFKKYFLTTNTSLCSFNIYVRTFYFVKYTLVFIPFLLVLYKTVTPLKKHTRFYIKNEKNIRIYNAYLKEIITKR